MSEDQFESAVGRVERELDAHGIDTTDFYEIVDWARKSRTLLAASAASLNELVDEIHGRRGGEA